MDYLIRISIIILLELALILGVRYGTLRYCTYPIFYVYKLQPVIELFAPPRILFYCLEFSFTSAQTTVTMSTLLPFIQCSSLSESDSTSSSFSDSSSHSPSPISSISSLSYSPLPKSSYKQIVFLPSPPFADVSFLQALASTLQKGAGDLVFLMAHSGNGENHDKDAMNTLLRKSLMEMDNDCVVWRQLMGNINGEY